MFAPVNCNIVRNHSTCAHCAHTCFLLRANCKRTLFNRNAFERNVWRFVQEPDKNVIIPKCQKKLCNLDGIYWNKPCTVISSNWKTHHFIRNIPTNGDRLLLDQIPVYELIFDPLWRLLKLKSRGFELKIYRIHSKNFWIDRTISQINSFNSEKLL